MPRKKIRALIILLVLAASVPVLRYLDRKFFQPEYLGYSRQGIGFVIDRHGIVEEIHVYPVKGAQGEVSENSEGNSLIYPGRGVGSIRFGDLEGEVREKWPAQLEGYGRKAAHIIYSREEGVNLRHRGGQPERRSGCRLREILGGAGTLCHLRILDRPATGISSSREIDRTISCPGRNPLDLFPLDS